MFTGIVEETGFIKSFDGHKLIVECSKVLENTQIGDSIAIDGCCQTVVAMNANSFSADVSSETLKITKGFKTGECVNLERALLPQTRMGGHIVQGHIDCTGKFVKKTDLNEFYKLKSNFLNQNFHNEKNLQYGGFII